MTSKEVFNLLSNCIFDGELDCISQEEKIFYRLPEDFSYEYREGASKLVIIPDGEDYVIKIPYTSERYRNDELNHFMYGSTLKNYCWDYCSTEVLLLDHARKENISEVFAKERVIGYINKHPIYVQQKAIVYNDSVLYNSASNEEKRKTIDYCKRNNLEVLVRETVSWQVDAFEYYGQKKFNKMMQFISNHCITDLHENNLGYINNKPVIIDWAGFFD